MTGKSPCCICLEPLKAVHMFGGGECLAEGERGKLDKLIREGCDCHCHVIESLKAERDELVERVWQLNDNLVRKTDYEGSILNKSTNAMIERFRPSNHSTSRASDRDNEIARLKKEIGECLCSATAGTCKSCWKAQEKIRGLLENSTSAGNEG